MACFVPGQIPLDSHITGSSWEICFWEEQRTGRHVPWAQPVITGSLPLLVHHMPHRADKHDLGCQSERRQQHCTTNA